MMDMSDVWKIYDREILETPMPSNCFLVCLFRRNLHMTSGEYQNMACAIQCRDCLKEGLGKFHILGTKVLPFSCCVRDEMEFSQGVKCEECGSYNTTRVKGPLLRRGRGRGPLIPPHLVVDSSDEEEEMPAARPSARFGHLGVRPYRQGRRYNRVPSYLRRTLTIRRDPDIGPIRRIRRNPPQMPHDLSEAA